MMSKTVVLVCVLVSLQIVCTYGDAGVDEYAKKICAAPVASGKGVERVRLTEVSGPVGFLSSSLKEVPAVCIGNGMACRYEVEEPSKDDEVMNAARQAIGETSPEVVEAKKKELVQLLKNDSKLNVPLDNDAWLVRFLRLRKYNVPATYTLIRNYYNFRAQNKKVYEGLRPTAMSEAVGSNVFAALPNRDPKGRRIAIFAIRNWDPKKFEAIDALKTGIVLTEMGSYEPATAIAGVEVILDLKGLTMDHIKQMTPSILKKIFDFMLRAAPYRDEGIHIVNQGRFFSAMYKLWRPFITKDLRRKMYFHGDDLKSLHSKIPASILPDIYGGPYPLYQFSNSEWNTLLEMFEEEFAKTNTYGVRSQRN